MSQIFKTGQTVETISSRSPCQVDQLLGGGGQGEVYRAAVAGRSVAVKWYYPQTATQRQRASIEILTRKGPPNSRFLWPTELVTAPGVAGFGYVMPLRDPRYRGLVELMKRKIDPSFQMLATAGFELAHSFLQLHSKGLCYRDISFGNVFLHPDTGEILICDNDNVTVDGDPAAGILGTPRFMAPEVVRGDALPSIQTDLFSLAVLLFYIFMVHHPLEGRKEMSIHSFDLAAMIQLYGTSPVFIYDPEDISNRPVPGYHDNALTFWPIYPQFLRDLFLRAFTDGIRDPLHGRIREGEWRAAMIRLRDSILYCSRCGAENFYDADLPPSSAGRSRTCWSCRQWVALPFRLRIGRHLVMLNHDRKLFPHHLEGHGSYDFSQPVAAVNRHPQQDKVWGLQNLSREKWSFLKAGDPRPKTLEPGRSVSLETGTTINFGPIEGTVEI